MPDIRYVAEIDRPGAPYTGPALLGARHVTVTSTRRPCFAQPHVEAQTSDGWHNTGLLRAVDRYT